jgi:hypothetical protein
LLLAPLLLLLPMSALAQANPASFDVHRPPDPDREGW